MVSRLLGLIEGPLRVPEPPSAPWGDPGSVETFRPSRGYLRYKAIKWTLHEGWAIGVAVVTIFFPFLIPNIWIFNWLVTDWMHVIEWIFLLMLPLILPVTFAFLYLDYRNRWYVLTDRSLRIREGVWTVREMTISLANVQNVSMSQGPIQRLCGIANVEVATAGGGDIEIGEGESMHRGTLRGVADASEVRDRIMRSWQEARQRQSEPAATVASPVSESPLVLSARALAAEASALRQQVAARR